MENYPYTKMSTLIIYFLIYNLHFLNLLAILKSKISEAEVCKIRNTKLFIHTYSNNLTIISKISYSNLLKMIVWTIETSILYF